MVSTRAVADSAHLPISDYAAIDDGRTVALVSCVCALPLLPYAHPRMASEHDGPSMGFRLEPPGFMGLNYGRGTPLTTLFAQTVYGLTLGAFAQISQVMVRSTGA